MPAMSARQIVWKYLNCPSEPHQQAAREGQIILKITGGFLTVVGQARIEVTHFDPEADGYFECVHYRASVNTAPKYKGPHIRTWFRRWNGGGRFFKESRITSTKRQPGRKRSGRMELHPNVGGEKNKSILAGNIPGLLAELHVIR